MLKSNKPRDASDIWRRVELIALTRVEDSVSHRTQILLDLAVMLQSGSRYLRGVSDLQKVGGPAIDWYWS